ncbi:MAG TPA: acyl-CoA dehydrogenase domain-containing protein, partial [Woeseiaceae bacterium]|nr:acyl-CoA dehydrogenase domain-containing protein [Woeseiaceae bacterium]
KVADLITQTGDSRERLCEQAYTTLEPGNPLGMLEEALRLSEELAPLESRLHKSHKDGVLKNDYLGYQIDEAEQAGIISADEAGALRDYHARVQALMAVDDFEPEALVRPAAEEPAKTSARGGNQAPKKAAARKKTATRRKSASRKKSS